MGNRSFDVAVGPAAGADGEVEVASLISPILLDGTGWTNWEMREVRATALD
jgi:hypothetical protein